MLLGPIFQLETVSAARRKRYFVLRVLYGALILFVLWASYQSIHGREYLPGNHMSIRASTQLAAAFFHSFSFLQMLAIVMVGPAMVAGAIATERERRTIEYLFATELADHEIILGKTVARLLLVGSLALVGLPILFVFRLFGGIPANLLLASFLLAASSALMIAAISVWVSVWSARARDAAKRVYLVLAALFFLPMALLSVGAQTFGANQFWQQMVEPAGSALLRINPLWALIHAVSYPSVTGQGLDLSTLLTSAGWQLVVSVVALAWATFAVRRVHLGAVSRGDVKRSRRLWKSQWRPPLSDRPMLWKEMYSGTAKTRLGIAGVLASALIVITFCGVTLYNFYEALSNERWTRPEDYFMYLAVLTGFIGSAMLLMLGSRAAGLVTLEKERDCWTSLLATPLSGREIMAGKMWGNLYSARWSFAMLASTWLLGMWINPGFLWAALAMGATFLLCAWYVTNLGLVFSLSSQSTMRAMGLTMATLVFAAGGYLFCCCAVFAESFGGRGDEALVFAPCIPFLLAFPAATYYDYFVGGHIARQSGIIGAYGCGLAFYLIVAVSLYAYMTAAFDRLVGRTGSFAGEDALR